MKKTTITIGIAAFNEEQNIGKLLENLLSQKTKSFTLESIVVVSDGSTDKTNQIVREYSRNNPVIKLWKNSKTKGQNFSQNRLLRKTQSDVLVLLEADTLPKENNYIENLVKPLITKKNVSMSIGNSYPLSSTFIGDVLAHQIMVYRKFFIETKFCKDISGRGGKALRVSSFSNFSWLKNVPEDSYIYFWAIQNNLTIKHPTSAINFFQVAGTFSDVVKNRNKVKATRNKISEYFPPEVTEKVFAPFCPQHVRSLLYFILLSPDKALAFCVIKAVSIYKENNHTNFDQNNYRTITSRSLHV